MGNTKLILCAMTSLALFGCTPSPNLPGSTGGAILEARFIRPPQSGIHLGSLYYAREQPTQSLDQPIRLYQLCIVGLDKYQVTPRIADVADMDLLESFEASGSLSGIKNEFVSLGLSGSLKDYFEFKATNVKRHELSLNDVENLMKQMERRRDCGEWRNNIRTQRWAAYQANVLYSGDIVFTRKRGPAFNADVSAKIAKMEPAVKAALNRQTNSVLSGKALFFGIVPISRS